MAVALEKELAYYEDLLASVNSSARPKGTSELVPVIKARGQAAFLAIAKATDQLADLYTELSAQNLNPVARLYAVTEPFTERTQQSLGWKSTAIAFVLMMLVTLIVVPAGCLIHSATRTAPTVETARLTPGQASQLSSRGAVSAYRGKRVVDLLLVLLSTPVWATAAVWYWPASVRVRLGRPVVFRQRRPGLHGREFELLKFRTMTDGRDAHGELLPDGLRLTPFGRWLRATSLDECPELWNVVTGDMSLIGPRPLLTDYLPLYSAEQARRHDVRPGITGRAAGQRSERADLGREVRPRCLVRRPCQPGARPHASS